MAGVSCWEAESRWKGSQLMPPSFCGDYSRLCTSDSVQQFHKSISFTARTPECEIKHLTRTRSFAERYTLTSDPLQFFLFWQFRGILKGGSEQTCKKRVHPHPFVKTTCNPANRKIKRYFLIYRLELLAHSKIIRKNCSWRRKVRENNVKTTASPKIVEVGF